MKEFRDLKSDDIDTIPETYFCKAEILEKEKTSEENLLELGRYFLVVLIIKTIPTCRKLCHLFTKF